MMIYFDNAATTLKKPQAVYDNLLDAVNKVGNNGRGFNNVSLDTGRMILDTRMKIARLFNIDNPKNIAFTSNATESLNIAINGILNKGDHVVTTVAEHNSVLRPLYMLEDRGDIEISFIKTLVDENHTRREGILDIASIEEMIRPSTKAIIITQASNVTGNITDIKKVAAIARKHDLILIVDAAQSAGVIDIDVSEMGIDILCFTGHKGLMGIQGTGGIYVREGIDLSPLKVGGSGIKSFDKTHPTSMPERLEAGTLNGHGIIALNGGLSFLLENGVKTIHDHENKLKEHFIAGIKDIDEIIFYGDRDISKRVGIVSINLANMESSTLAYKLAHDYDIATRAGAHCAPLMHQALGTENMGVVRFSFSYFNTLEEVDQAIDALRALSKEVK